MIRKFVWNDKRNGVILVGGMCILLIILKGMFTVSGGERMYIQRDIPIASGREVLTDLDGDGEEERVWVTDFWSDGDAFTQVVGRIGSETGAAVNYDGYYSSMIVTGDLSGNGHADVLLLNADIASNCCATGISILHYENGGWKEYSKQLIHNSSISMEQPSDFDLENSRMNSEPYIGATIIEKDGKHLLRLISLLREEGEQTVRCVEASYQEDGWFIENVEIYENYYRDKLCRTLLKNNY